MDIKNSLIVLMGFLLCMGTHQLHAQTKSEKILPETTKGFVVVENAHAIVSELEHTNFGGMFAQEEVHKAVESIEKQIKEILKEKKISIGDFDEFAQVASGEVSFSVIAPNAETLAICVLVQTANENDKQAKDLITSIGKELKASGAKVLKPYKVADSEVHSFQIEKGIGFKRGGAKEGEVNAFYTVAKDWMVVTNNKEVTEHVVKQINGLKTFKTLDTVQRFNKVFERCAKERNGLKPHLRWYVDPFGLAQAIKSGITQDQFSKEYLPKLMNKSHGLTTIQAVAGELTVNCEVKSEQFETLTRTYIYAPKLYEQKGAIEALDFRNDGKTNLKPEAWIPGNVGAYSAFTMDIKKAFKSSFGLIDDITDNEGTVDKFMKALKERKDVEVDIENDIIENLGKKISFVSDPNAKTPLNAERLLICVKIEKNTEAVTSAINRMLDVKKRGGEAELVMHKGVKIWKVSAPKAGSGGTGEPDIVPGISIDDVPGLEPIKTEKKKLLEKPLIESQVFFVTKDQIMISNNVEYAKKIIDMPLELKDDAETLTATPGFMQVNRSLDMLVKDANSARQFGQTAKLYRAGYELARTGKMKDSKSIMGTLIKLALKPKKDAKPPKLIDAKLLPNDYDKFIAPFLGDFGVALKCESDGWLITGVIKKPVVNKSVANKTADGGTSEKK